jgi:hypothetical protein
LCKFIAQNNGFLCTIFIDRYMYFDYVLHHLPFLCPPLSDSLSSIFMLSCLFLLNFIWEKNLKHLSESGWLHLSWRSIHFSENYIILFFLWLNNTSFCIYDIFFICSSVDCQSGLIP